MNKLTPKEKGIVMRLKEIENDKDFVITSFLAATEDGTIDALYDFLITNGKIDSDDVLNFLVPGEDDND